MQALTWTQLPKWLLPSVTTPLSSPLFKQTTLLPQLQWALALVTPTWARLLTLTCPMFLT